MAIGHCNEISRLHRTRCFDRLNRVGRGGLDSARQMRERNTTQQVRQLRDIHRDPARLVFAEQPVIRSRPRVMASRYVSAILMIGRGLPTGGLEGSCPSKISVRPTRSYSAEIVSSQ